MRVLRERLQVAQEMRLQVRRVGIGVVSQKLVETRAKAPVPEYRTEGDVQDLPGVELLEQAGQFQVIHVPRERRIIEARRNVVAGPVLLVTFPGKCVDAPEELRVERGNGAQRLQIASAGGLQMNQAPGLTYCGRIDSELVRAGV